MKILKKIIGKFKEILFYLFHNLKIMRLNNYFRNHRSPLFWFRRNIFELRIKYVETIIRFKVLFIICFIFVISRRY